MILLYKSILTILFINILLLISVRSLVHDLRINNDDRFLFKIETFGFLEGGVTEIHLTDLSLHGLSTTSLMDNNEHQYINSQDLSLISNAADIDNNLYANYSIGLLMRRTDSESGAQQDIEKALENNECVLDVDRRLASDLYLDLSSPSSWKSSSLLHSIPPGAAGLYSLMFARCSPAGHHRISFRLKAKFFNPGPNYLSAGDSPLPFLYLSFFSLFLIITIIWIYVITTAMKTSGTTVHNIHHTMSVLVILKTITLFFESLRFHLLSLTGTSDIWSAVYYFFAVCKGIMLFVVILLIGSGWTLMRPYLNDREKKIILTVLILQVIDNVAIIIVAETAPGSIGWLTWRDILHLLDILCCCAILIPIVWSIRHLRQAAEADGKMQNTLAKLQLFRQFYVMVVTYVYFTRIVVYLLEATIPFYLYWFGELFTELATLILFVVTGFKFRPVPDNPYFNVSTEDGDVVNGERGAEFGLEEHHRGGVDNDGAKK